MSEPLRIVYITTESADDARYIGSALLEDRLAACVNIIDGMESMYWWNDEIESAQECILLAKTTASHVEELTERVIQLHEYSCPCVISISLEPGEGNPEYLLWLRNQVKS
jgi:periplasmic divalent cation tolerance protein